LHLSSFSAPSRLFPVCCSALWIQVLTKEEYWLLPSTQFMSLHLMLVISFFYFFFIVLLLFFWVEIWFLQNRLQCWMMVVHTLDFNLTWEDEIRHLGFSGISIKFIFPISNNHYCGNMSLFLGNTCFMIHGLNCQWTVCSGSRWIYLLKVGIDFAKGGFYQKKILLRVVAWFWAEDGGG